MLAVGIDAAEPTLIRRLIDDGTLPTLAQLRADGSWTRIHSPAHIGSGAVWPTFMTGTEPDRHGVFGDWNWLPETMKVAPALRDRLRPFWASLEHDGLTAGVLDVEFAPHVGLSRGFELTEWGAEYSMQGATVVSPREIAPIVDAKHPFDTGRYEPNAGDQIDRKALASACIEGAARRGRLAQRLLERTLPDVTTVVFVEAHRAGHDLWHDVEPDHPLYADLPANREHPRPGLVDVYREIDRQIARLVEAVGEEAAVFVFSLHGMRPSRGISTVLEPVLTELGFANRPRPGRWSPSEAARGAFALVKRRTPRAAKRLYHRSVPRDARSWLAAPTLLPVLDWSRTRAFALTSDQHGWVRVNLRGREAEGIVEPDDYEATCEELRTALEGLRTEDGRPVVSEVLRADPSGNPPALLPDLVVHWTYAALEWPVRIRDPAIEAWPIASNSTGQHAPDGFCVARGLGEPLDDPLEAADLPKLLRAACV